MTSVADSSPQLTGQPVQTALRQPKPKPPKRPYASFLEDFVDPAHPNHRTESVYTFISNWLETVGSDRAKRCRSDSHLERSESDPISRQLTRSAPEMSYRRDADGFVVPPTPASTRSRHSFQPSEDSASSTSSVRHPSYRQNNLDLNGIYEIPELRCPIISPVMLRHCEQSSGTHLICRLNKSMDILTGWIPLGADARRPMWRNSLMILYFQKTMTSPMAAVRAWKAPSRP